MSVVYKVLHIPTGLFFQPSTGRWSKDKTNLGKEGKVYTKKWFAVDSDLKSVYISHVQTEKLQIKYKEYRDGSRYLDCKPEDWRLVTYNLTEILD